MVPDAVSWFGLFAPAGTPQSEPTTVGELAEALVMDSGALARTLKPLERDSLAAVAVDPGDRRNRLITLIRRGRAKLAETDVLWAKAQRGFEAALGRAESKALREVLRFLMSSILCFRGKGMDRRQMVRSATTS